jgi:hypothetical protein
MSGATIPHKQHELKSMSTFFHCGRFWALDLCGFNPVIHPWMASYMEENHGIKNNKPPPSAHVLLSRKGMPVPRGGTPKILISISATNPSYICRLRSFPMVSCMLLSHGSQAVQTSRFSAARVPMHTCGMWCVYLTVHITILCKGDGWIRSG